MIRLLAAALLTGVAAVARADGAGTIDLTSLQAQIATTGQQVTVLTNQVATQGQTAGTMQGQVTTAQGQVTSLQGQVATLQGQVAALQAQMPQAALATTDGNGLWSVAWARAFATASPAIAPQPVNAAASNAVVCNVTSRSATAAAGKCWAVGSLNAAAAFPVMIFGRDTTQ